MAGGEDYNHQLSGAEAAFILERDSFYMASVGETGWPYIQHRGGPAGFVRVLDENTIGFADFSGNRQYISTGNFRKDDRVALFFMDYANKRRLKMLGRVEQVEANDYEGMAALEMDDYRARVERGFVIKIEGFDWNCPQHITPRYSEDQLAQLINPLQEENQQLKARLAQTASDAGSLQKSTELGDGPLSLSISGIRQLTPRVRAYELRHPEGGELPVFTAGAHLQVPVQLGDGKTVYRHYSICSNPKRRDMYEIAVLLDEDGQGGSKALQQSFGLGLVLHCQPPENYFALHDDDRPAVLIAGGIGITPIKAMAQTLKCRGIDLQLHYAGRHGDEMAFLDRLQREFGEQLSSYRSEQNERMDLTHVLSSAVSESLIYICGPERLIAGVVSTAESLGIDPERIRFERFSAAPAEGSQAIELELSRSGKQIAVGADQSILDAMLEQGVEANFGCRTGNCKSCVLKVVEGEVDHRDTALSAAEREDQQLMTPCVSRAKGKRLVLDI